MGGRSQCSGGGRGRKKSRAATLTGAWMARDQVTDDRETVSTAVQQDPVSRPRPRWPIQPVPTLPPTSLPLRSSWCSSASVWLQCPHGLPITEDRLHYRPGKPYRGFPGVEVRGVAELTAARRHRYVCAARQVPRMLPTYWRLIASPNPVPPVRCWESLTVAAYAAHAHAQAQAPKRPRSQAVLTPSDCPVDPPERRE